MMVASIIKLGVVLVAVERCCCCCFKNSFVRGGIEDHWKLDHDSMQELLTVSCCIIKQELSTCGVTQICIAILETGGSGTETSARWTTILIVCSFQYVTRPRVYVFRYQCETTDPSTLGR